MAVLGKRLIGIDIGRIGFGNSGHKRGLVRGKGFTDMEIGRERLQQLWSSERAGVSSGWSSSGWSFTGGSAD